MGKQAVTWREVVRHPAVLTFLLLPFFIPYSIRFIPTFTRAYDMVNVWKLVAVLIIAFLFAIRRRITVVTLFIIGVNVVIWGSSFLHGLRGSNNYTDLLPAVGLPMLAEMAISVDRRGFVRVLSRILGTFVFINALGVLAFPGGMPMATLYTQTRNPLHFLGQDNGMVYVLLPFLGLSYVRSDDGLRRWFLRLRPHGARWSVSPWLIVVDLVAVITMVRVGSATGLVVVLLFLGLLTLSNTRGRGIRQAIPLGAYALFFVGIVVLGSSSTIVRAITDLLGRDAGFTGRSLLWERAIALIGRSPAIGYGNEPELIEIWGSSFSAHNQLLDVALRGGLLTLTLFVLAHLGAFRRLRQVPTYAANVIFVTIFCFLAGGLMEAGVRPLQYVFLTFAAGVAFFDERSISQVKAGTA